MEKERYIILLNNQQTKSLKKVEKELELSITSSVELSSANRSFDIINEANGVLYKNLNILVADNLDELQLTAAVANENNPIIYFEKEREFFPTGELEMIQELKVLAAQFQSKIEEIEKYIKNKPLPKQNFGDMEWGLKAMGLDKTIYSGKGVDICVLDTGFDTSHPDFVLRSIEGKSFIANEPWDNDVNGHGTHCTGIAAGNIRNDNGKRYGIAKEANIKIGKVLANNGRGTTSSVIDAIDWAITKGFRIISMSLASPVKLNEKPSPLFEAVGKKALENNCLIIAAAGNDSNRPSMPEPVSAPANAISIMAVAAIDSQMNIARFSNGGINSASGGNINVCAPGVDIVSAYIKNSKSNEVYRAMNGTSMATPHVSGLAALYMEQFPQKTAKDIWEMLESNAQKIEGLKYRDIGNGLIQTI